MGIAWKYLDKKSAADAVKDYGGMKFIIEHTVHQSSRAAFKSSILEYPLTSGSREIRRTSAIASRFFWLYADISTAKGSPPGKGRLLSPARTITACLSRTTKAAEKEIVSKG